MCIEWNWFKYSDALFFSKKVRSSNFESLHNDFTDEEGSNRVIVNGKGVIGFEFKFQFYHRNATEKYR